MPQQLRRARAFEKIVTEIPIYIDDEQLLVGDFGAWPSAAEWHPEHNLTWENREFQAGRPPYGLDEKAVAEFKKILDYWTSRNVRNSFVATIDEAERKRLDEVAEESACVYSMYVEMMSDKGWYCPDHEKAIRNGFLGILAEVEEELRATPVVDDASREKRHLLEAVAIELKAGIKYSNRYSALARKLAKTARHARVYVVS